MAKFEKKMQAHALRRQGISIGNIAKKLQVSKSSASLWCQDLDLTEAEKDLIQKNGEAAGHRGRMAGAAQRRKKREAIVKDFEKQGKETIAHLSPRELLLAGACLYWAEGAKGRKFSFTNSDPVMIRFISQWVVKSLGVPKRDFFPWIFINEIHKPRFKVVLAFWSKELGIPETQFRKPVFLKVQNKKVYKNHETYYGILTLRARNSTQLQYKILGLIKGLGVAKMSE